MKRIALFMLVAGCCLAYAGCASQERPSFPRGSGHYRNAPAAAQVKNFFAQVRHPAGNPEAHYRLASWYLGRGKYREALQEFEKVVAVSPDHVEAYNGMGVSWDRLGDFARAAACYEKALQINPSLDYVHNNLGYSYLLQGNAAAAVAALNRATAINDRKNRIHNNLGIAYAMLDKKDLALSEFAKTGDRALALGNTARVYLEKGLPAEARKLFLAALDADPALPGAREGLDSCNVLIATAAERGEESGGTADNPGIELANGNGVRRMARHVGGYLKERGFNVVRLTNADHFHYPATGIYYRADSADTARRLADEMPGRWQLRKAAGFEKPGVKVRVLIGKDLIRYKNKFEGGLS
jgi:Flp pilus assembly protein TadD